MNKKNLSEKIKERKKLLKKQLMEKENQIKTTREAINNLQNQLNKLIQEHLFLQGKLSECEELLKGD